MLNESEIEFYNSWLCYSLGRWFCISQVHSPYPQTRLNNKKRSWKMVKVWVLLNTMLALSGLSQGLNLGRWIAEPVCNKLSRKVGPKCRSLEKGLVFISQNTEDPDKKKDGRENPQNTKDPKRTKDITLPKWDRKARWIQTPEWVKENKTI